MFTPNRSLSIDELEADHDQIVSRRDAHGLRKGWVAVKPCGIEKADCVRCRDSLDLAEALRFHPKVSMIISESYICP